MTKSRLHRRLSPQGAPLFHLKIGDKTYNDSNIHSIVITRGQSGYTYGVQPATLSTELPGLLGNLNNEHVELKLSPWFADHLQKEVSIGRDSLEWRYYGRVGLQDSTDNGTGRHSTTNVSASSYSALLKPTTRTYRVRDRTTVLNVIRAILEHPSMPTRLRTFPGAYGDEVWDLTYIEEIKEMTFSEIIAEYAEKQLILICERRDGYMHVQSLYLRERYLIDRATGRYAPLRSHTLAPATWTQPNEGRSANLVLKARSDSGEISYTTWGSGRAENHNKEYPIETEEVDLTHVRAVSDTNHRVMRALNYQKNIPRVQISSVKFDLIELLSSRKWYDRRMGGELLRLEHGDAVYFSGDWQSQIRIPMIAQEIRETITPSKWEIEITLEHPANLLGIHHTPPHPPRVWDQHTGRWDEETGTWDI